MSTRLSLSELVLAGDVRGVARTISLIEAHSPLADDIAAEIFPHTGRASVVGVTGPPGVGKSTLVERMVLVWRARGKTVGIIAIDPSSPFTRGAILGDRIRMASLDRDNGVFIRSMANRAHLGGLAEATPAAVRILDAAGYDIVIVETVGVGQSEVAVADAADCTVLVLMPGGGDAIQAMKAGVLEIGNVFVVNKADRDGASRVERELNAMLHLGDLPKTPRVLLTQADQGHNVDAVVDAVEEWLKEATVIGQLEEHRIVRLQREALEHLAWAARQQVMRDLHNEVVQYLVERLRRREIDPASAARQALDTVRLKSDSSAAGGTEVCRGYE